MNHLPVEKFNDDLLLTETDRELAKRRFPELFHVLDFPELREVFLSYDVPSNRAKKHRRRAGFIAILLGVLALLGTSAAPWYKVRETQQVQLAQQVHDARWPSVLAGSSALLGLGSLLIGIIGSLSGEQKYKWLCNRLMTERLRQFHFQLLVRRIPEILASMVNQPGQEEFRELRRSWLAGYRMAYEGHLPARLRVILDDDEEDDFLLHHGLEHWQGADRPDANLDRIFSAYRLLRFEHQLQYTNYKLGKEGSSFSSSSVRQLEVLRDLSLVGIVIVFVAHLGLALSLALGWAGSGASNYIDLGIIWIVIAILTIRTLEEGLQPAREVERYTRYRSSLMSLLNRFDKARSAKEKMRIMYEAERASYEELRGFLKINYEAKYVL
jgi:hypothetical protein